MLEWIIMNRIAIAVGAVLLSCLVAYMFSARVRFHVMDLWARFPLIGTIARLSRDSVDPDKNGWRLTERTLCAKYKPYCAKITPKEFERNQEYLRKSTDIGRKPTPMWVIALLVVLLIAEGLGFSYLLGSWLAREGSEQTHTILMIAIVFVLCIILVTLTHFAGHQFYRTSLLRSFFRSFKQDSNATNLNFRVIRLSEDQSKDDNDQQYLQGLNRIAKEANDRGSYIACWFTLVCVILIAVGSTYMRMQSLERELINETTLSQHTAAPAGNPFLNLVLPDEVQASQEQAERGALGHLQSALKGEGMAAFVVLALIFIITQVVGMGAGYIYGFAGRQSRAAYEGVRGANTWAAYEALMQPYFDTASARLKDLQQRIKEDSNDKSGFDKTFEQYIDEENLKLEESFNAQRSRQASANQGAAPVHADTRKVHSDAAVQERFDAIAEKTHAPQVIASSEGEAHHVSDPVAAAIAKIQDLDDADMEKNYYLSLPEKVRKNPVLIDFLKNRKAERERQPNIEDLF